MQVETLMLGPVCTNCYILSSSSLPGKAIVIDPAHNAPQILSHLREKGLELSFILLTHTHFDHIEALDELVSATGAQLFCPKKDAPGLRDFITNGSMILFRYPVLVNTPPSRLLVEGDEITFGREKLTVIETPGHTVGSVCYDDGENLFTGDTLFCSGRGRTDLPGGSEAQLRASLQRLMPLLSTHTVCGGHGA